MGSYLAVFGLMSNVALGDASIVQIHSDITVKPTPDTLLSPADSVDVTMNCTGSRRDIRYYINNRMRWTFIANSGKELILTDSFYVAEDAVNSFNYPNERLSLTYHEYIKGFKFGITIRGVTRADDGIYRCSIVGENNHVIDSKDVKLTVVNPVERMHIELYDAHHVLISTSDSPVFQISQELKIAPGQYTVKCRSHGSNPEPVMALFLNGKKVNISIKSKQHKSSEFESYTGRLKAHRLAITARNTPQTLVCKANIPGDIYQPSTVGITLLVENTKPTIACEHTSEAVGDIFRKLMCNVSVVGNKEDRVCVSWVLGKREQLTENDQRWTDQRKECDNLESNSRTDAMLNIYIVNSEVFQEKIFIFDVKGEHVKKIRITLHDITTASANMVTSLPVLLYIALALTLQVWGTINF